MRVIHVVSPERRRLPPIPRFQTFRCIALVRKKGAITGMLLPRFRRALRQVELHGVSSRAIQPA